MITNYDEWIVTRLNNFYNDDDDMHDACSMCVWWEEEKDIPQRFPSFSKTDWNNQTIWLFEVTTF